MNKLTDRDNVFNNHQPYRVERNGFDLTHKTISSWDMGKLYPISCVECYPNDYFKTSIQYRMMLESLFKPIYSNIKIKFRQFFVSYRSMWKKWRNYYTGGRDGNYTTLEPKVNINCPSNIKGSLFDYLGFPLQSQFGNSTEPVLVSAFPFVAYDFIYYWNFINPHLQENIIYNIQDQLFIDVQTGLKNVDENTWTFFLSDDFYTKVAGRPMYFRSILPFYNSTLGRSWTNHLISGKTTNDYAAWLTEGSSTNRSPTLIFKTSDGKFLSYDRTYQVDGSDITLTMEMTSQVSNIGYLFNVNWEKDYFTSAYKTRQLGTPPSVPITVTMDNKNNPDDNLWTLQPTPNKIYASETPGIGNPLQAKAGVLYGSGAQGNKQAVGLIQSDVSPIFITNNNMNEYLKKVTFSEASFVANDLRLMFAIQQIQEGALLSQKSFEYTSYLKYFFGKGPSHQDLQQPYYVGGFNSVFYTSEVMQTAPTDDSVVGDYAGKGASIDSGFAGDFNVDEPGCLMTLMYIVPANVSQSSQGINRQWLRDDRFDYYNPAFAHLGLQEIQSQELYTTGKSVDDTKVFGFTGAFNELRYIPDTVTSDMRDTLDIWHLARKYSGKQTLTSEYIKCRPSKRIFATQLADVPNITGIVNLVMIAYRDLPDLPIPELLDHRY